ncbi:MAG: hypothetical protein IH819_07110 [Bacteroidetes bacterium]|nr:hypothetical protein [Bacteroidota bacterium]
MKTTFIFLFSVIIAGLVIVGCDSENSTDNPISTQNQFEKESYQDGERILGKFSRELRKELALVKSATARYHNIANAEVDGYVDIDLFAPNQGWHYLKESLVDVTFDLEKPELLVYAPKPNGGFRLVAVEYAVPVELSTEAPDGFTGEEDVWEINEEFGLWVLHTWVWYHNPDGMFNPTNPRVQTEP